MGFVKRNLILMIVFLITLLVFIYMVVQCSVMNFQINKSIVHRDEAVRKIAAAYEKRNPNVNESNRRKILEDFQKIDQKTFELQNTFGKFYRKAFAAFAATIESSRDEYLAAKSKKENKKILSTDSFEKRLLKSFADYYNACPQEDRPSLANSKKDEDFVNGFFKNYYIYLDGVPEKGKAADPGIETRIAVYEKALKDFAVALQPVVIDRIDPAGIKVDFSESGKGSSLEKVESPAVYQYLLAAMGVPRTASISIYKDLLSTAKGNFVRIRMINGVNTEVEMTRYTSELERIVDQSMIPSFIQQLQIRKDFFLRLRDAGVLKIESFSAKSPVQGVPVGNRYKKHTFQVSFTGTMAVLQSVLEKFGQEALADNVVYIVNEVSVSRVSPENVSKLIRADNTETGKSQKTVNQSQEQGGQPEEEPIVFGQTKEISVSMQISCVSYVGDELPRFKDNK